MTFKLRNSELLACVIHELGSNLGWILIFFIVVLRSLILNMFGAGGGVKYKGMLTPLSGNLQPKPCALNLKSLNLQS